MNIAPLKQRLTSRKFWLTVGTALSIIGSALTGAVDPFEALMALVTLVTGYNVGNGLQKRDG